MKGGEGEKKGEEGKEEVKEEVKEDDKLLTLEEKAERALLEGKLIREEGIVLCCFFWLSSDGNRCCCIYLCCVFPCDLLMKWEVTVFILCFSC